MRAATAKAYDATGTLRTSTDARGRTAAYAYDALNRITQVQYSDETLAYAYDVTGITIPEVAGMCRVIRSG